MSSHHFVKDGQEPALIIVDALALELAEPLLEWVPQVVVLDQALDEVISWGIKVDVVVQSSQSESQLQELLVDQFPVRIITAGPEEDPRITALNFAIRTSQAVNLLMNPSPDGFTLLERFSKSINIISRTEKWQLCQRHFEKWLPANTTLFLRQTTPDQKLILEGMTRKGDWFETDFDGPIRVHSAAPFWVGDLL